MKLHQPDIDHRSREPGDLHAVADTYAQLTDCFDQEGEYLGREMVGGGGQPIAGERDRCRYRVVSKTLLATRRPAGALARRGM